MELKELTNNQKRKEFLEDYTGWDIWLDVPDASANVITNILFRMDQ